MRNQDNSLNQDYDFFVSLDDQSTTLPPEVPASQVLKKEFPQLHARIRRDLVKSPRQMAVLYLGLSLIGYVLSLLVCAQNTLGLSGMAHSVAAELHRLPDPWCPIVCGAVFTGIPFALSSVFLTRFQQRYLIFKMWWFLAAIPILTSGLMVFLPHGMQHAKLQGVLKEVTERPDLLSDSAWMAIWAAAAIIVPYLLEFVVYIFVRPKRVKA